MKFLYDGVDIAPDVSIGACWLTQFLGGHEDLLRIDFADGEHRWSQWASDTEPRASVRVQENAIDSGALYLRRATWRNGTAEIAAGSLPPSAHDLQARSWEGATLASITLEIAQAHGLSASLQADLDALKYVFAGWRNRSDFSALSELCALEGLDVGVWDRRLIVTDRGLAQAEKQKTIEALEDQDFAITWQDVPDRVVVRNGTFEGASGDGPRAALVAADLPAFDQATVDRWAAATLARLCSRACVGSITFDHLIDDLAPGSVFSLDTGVSGMPARVVCTSLVLDFFERSSVVRFQGGRDA